MEKQLLVKLHCLKYNNLLEVYFITLRNSSIFVQIKDK